MHTLRIWSNVQLKKGGGVKGGSMGAILAIGERREGFRLFLIRWLMQLSDTSSLVLEVETIR